MCVLLTAESSLVLRGQAQGLWDHWHAKVSCTSHKEPLLFAQGLPAHGSGAAGSSVGSLSAWGCLPTATVVLGIGILPCLLHSWQQWKELNAAFY